ncbi:MAG: hypothetical protein Q4E44_03625 [bacterium]|nr:hypothetical protein [bacterium]
MAVVAKAVDIIVAEKAATIRSLRDLGIDKATIAAATGLGLEDVDRLMEDLDRTYLRIILILLHTKAVSI